MNINIEFDNIKYMDLHMHTSFSDGENSPTDMLKAAAKKGMKVIGISDHSYTYFDESYCIPKDDVRDYYASVLQIKERCKDMQNNPRFQKALGCETIDVFIGIEQDYYSTYPANDFDYVIGSVHYIRIFKGEKQLIPGCLKYLEHIFIPVDESPEILLNAANSYYNGDIYSLIEDYYLAVADVADHTKCDIIGHFDLISKFNENNALFDSSNERYVAAWKKAADNLLKSGALFEINTGAISRGYRTAPYPSNDMISYIRSNGGQFIYSSDAHSADNIGYGFDNFEL